jgi:hypothetical protein
VSVSLADFTGEFLDVGGQFGAQNNLVGGERRCGRNIPPRHSHPKPPE